MICACNSNTQEDQEIKASLGYMWRPCLTTTPSYKQLPSPKNPKTKKINPNKESSEIIVTIGCLFDKNLEVYQSFGKYIHEKSFTSHTLAIKTGKWHQLHGLLVRSTRMGCRRHTSWWRET